MDNAVKHKGVKGKSEKKESDGMINCWKRHLGGLFLDKLIGHLVRMLYCVWYVMCIVTLLMYRYGCGKVVGKHFSNIKS